MHEAEAFERAIIENSDDLASYSAYADWLQERDDPRGAFIAVQLALEDEAHSGAARDALKEREQELLAAHEHAWLGELAPHFLDRHDQHGNPRPTVEYWWGRGFISEMRVQHFTVPLARAVAQSPATRLLHKLHIESAPRNLRLPPLGVRRRDQPDLLEYLEMPEGSTDPVPVPELEEPTLLSTSEREPCFELIGSPCLQSLRVFQFGADAESEPDGWTEATAEALGLEHLVASMPRIEELYLLCHGYDAKALFALPNLSHLQVLRIYGLGQQGAPDQPIPLQALARNPVLGALTHLLVHPQYTRARAFLPLSEVRELVNAPHLKSLSHLQLRLSNMGDEGVSALVASGIMKRLGWLDLRNGAITDAGARLFAECAATRSLRRLDLSRNAVTSIGMGMLKRMGVSALASAAPSKREQEALDAQARNARWGYDPNRDGDDYDME
jgi:uncharacterized protein (TIGR02996 family)